MTNNQSPDMPEEINPYDVVTAAMQAGFMLSTGFGQEPGKIMPVSDAETLMDFHRALLAMRPARAALIKPEPVADLEALKAEAFGAVNHELIAGKTIEGRGDVNIIIDYLAAQGHLRPAVPREDRIAKLEDALRDISTLETRWGFYLADAVTIASKALEE